jgi:hypothetical protein
VIPRRFLRGIDQGALDDPVESAVRMPDASLPYP